MTRKEEIKKEMDILIEQDALDAFMLVITDIISCDSKAIVIGRRADIIEKAFGVSLVEDTIFLKGIVSRKKQIVPNIMDASK